MPEINEPILDFIKREMTFSKEMDIIIYRFDEVIVDRFKDGKFILNSQEKIENKYIKELRAFSDKGEIYIWRKGDKHFYRKLEEEKIIENKKLYVYEEEHYVLGAKSDTEPDTLVEIKRGIKIKLPFELKNQNLKYLIKNYYLPNEETGFIEIFDSRIVKFIV